MSAIQQLVRSEARFREASDTVRCAEGLSARQPQELVHRLVAHFQRLFDCPTLDGTVTRMNQVRAKRHYFGGSNSFRLWHPACKASSIVEALNFKLPDFSLKAYKKSLNRFIM